MKCWQMVLINSEEVRQIEYENHFKWKFSITAFQLSTASHPGDNYYQSLSQKQNKKKKKYWNENGNKTVQNYFPYLVVISSGTRNASLHLHLWPPPPLEDEKLSTNCHWEGFSEYMLSFGHKLLHHLLLIIIKA